MLANSVAHEYARLQRACAGKADELKLLCCASVLPPVVRKGVLPLPAGQVASGFDLQKAAAYLPAMHQMPVYCAPDVVAADVGAHPVLPQAALRDRDYGLWAGQDLRERTPAEQLSLLSDVAFAPPEGESFAACYQRVALWLDGISRSGPVAVVLARPAVVRNMLLRVLYQGEGAINMAQAARVDVMPNSYSLLTHHAGQWRLGMLAAPA